MNHFIKSNFFNINFDWLATTLNPYYEQIDFDAFVLDDRFIQDSHCFQNWFFASLNTGDLLHGKFADDLQAHICRTYGLTESDDCQVFDCITGDGAFNCLSDPERQEEMVFKLIFNEFMVGARFLKHNASMVLKFFTFYSCETISLLYFICNCFREITCYKPVASKHGNSEIYLVCLKFDHNAYKSLLPRFGVLQAEKFIIDRNLIPQDFISQVKELCKEISIRQMESINLNVKMFGKVSSEQMKAITRNKYTIGNMFIQKFNLFSIPPSEQLVFGDRYRKTYSKKFYNLFNEYQFHDSKPLFCSNLAKLFDHDLILDFAPQTFSIQNRNIKLKLTTGLPYEQINNSKFCCPYVLRSFIIATSSIDFTFNVNTTSLFLDIIQDVVNENHRIFFYEQPTPFSECIGNECTKQNLTGIEYCKLGQNKESLLDSVAIHFLDLYDSSPTITSNDFDLCCKLKNNFNDLVTNKHIRANHILAIRFKIVLSRLSVGLVYVLSKAFRKLTIFPHASSADSIHPSLFVVMSGFRQLPPQCQSIFSEESRDIWTNKLLELVTVPDIVSDQDFFDAIFNANSVCILSCIKQQLANHSEVHSSVH